MNPPQRLSAPLARRKLFRPWDELNGLEQGEIIKSCGGYRWFFHVWWLKTGRSWEFARIKGGGIV